jgi:signal peptidase I
MQKQTRWTNLLSSALLLIGMIAVWAVFAPVQFGGQVAYVMVNGNSMEPLYHLGDLVIVQRASEYQVGDIVTYRNPYIGPVIHRIVGVQGEQFILKGDHNTWTDSFLPGRTDIVGKAWIHLPGAGKVIGVIRQPWLLSILVGLASAALLFSLIPAKGEKRLRRGRPARKGNTFVMKTLFKDHDDWTFTLIVVAGVAGVLAIVAFFHPLTHSVVRDLHYEQNGAFSYAAAVSADSTVYASTGVETGQPIYRQLVSQVDFNFDYRIGSESPLQADGTARLIAVLEANDGWQQVIELQPETAFSGSTVSLAGTLDLDQVQSILDNLQSQTKIERQNYTIYIVPRIAWKGSVGPEAVDATFSPQLQFQIDPFELQVVRPDPTGPDPLFPVSDSAVQVTSVQPNTLSIFGLKLPVLATRWAASVLLALALGGLIGLEIYFNNKARREGAVERIQRKYSGLLVEVSANFPGKDKSIRDLGSIDDLARLAEKEGWAILHGVQGNVHVYFIEGQERVYRFTLQEGQAE